MEEEIHVRVEDDPPEHTLRPITYVSWLLGVGVARPKNCPKWITVILRLIHLGVCSVIVAFSVMDFPNFKKEFDSKLFEIMYCMNESVSHVSTYYYVYHVMRHYDKWPELINALRSLDQNIEKEISINDRCVRIAQTVAICTVLLCGPISLTAHVLYYYFIAPNEIYASDLLLYYTIAQILVNSFVFDIIVYIICHRFRAINEIIMRLNGGIGVYWTALKIRRIRKLHNETCCIITMVNNIYGTNVLLCSTNAFIMVVAKLFRIYMSAVDNKNGFIFLNNVIWIIYGSQFVIMCWVCTLTQREIMKVGLYISEFVLNVRCPKFKKSNSFRNVRNNEPDQLEIHSIGLSNGYETESDCVRNEINDFLLQLQQHQIAFTACDFFELDNSLLTKFISAITTYLIILVQFYKPELSI